MDIKILKDQHPILKEISQYKEVFWVNEKLGKKKEQAFNIEDIEDAERRLNRFKPYIAKVFPETFDVGGIIESPLIDIANMQEHLGKMTDADIKGRLMLKCDSHLPISGSIKARGGIYEVLKFAEKVAIDSGLLKEDDDYGVLCDEKFKTLFSQYSVAVGSTGNLGLAVGIMSAKLGFSVTVHMSSDAKEWKKRILRSRGVNVVEYEDDYQVAVAEGRKAAEQDEKCHFVDDEDSADLFLGYSVAAKRLASQMKNMGIRCDEEHPLFVYIPCGVGGAPAGVGFGLKTIFNDNVHVFFAEPTHAPCMTIGMITGLNNEISVYDMGLDGITEADGLAVGRASKLAGNAMETLLDGCYTVEDYRLYDFLAMLADYEGRYAEPSACAAFMGPALVMQNKNYLKSLNLEDKLKNATHIVWATGGNMMPEKERNEYYVKGKEQLNQKRNKQKRNKK